jgi:4a-hydroxytetrahydrobiopterin dehydratase
MMPRLSETQIEAVLSALSGWSLVFPQNAQEGGALSKTFGFRDFVQAMIWVNRVAEEAEDVNHHPDIAIHYNEVTLTLWTHTEGGVTERDAMLAEAIDDLPRQNDEE